MLRGSARSIAGFHIRDALAAVDARPSGPDRAFRRPCDGGRPDPPEPRFDGVFRVVEWRVVGERHLKLRLSAGGAAIDAIQFGGWQGGAPPREVAAVYRLAPDDFRDRGGVQLQVEHLLPA
jgi:hypothetical protein